MITLFGFRIDAFRKEIQNAAADDKLVFSQTMRAAPKKATQPKNKQSKHDMARREEGVYDGLVCVREGWRKRNRAQRLKRTDV